MAKSQVNASIIPTAANSAGSTTRAALDVSGMDGGCITFRIQNALTFNGTATTPTAQCVGRIYIAHKGTAMPATAAEGSGPLDWKQVYEIGNGIASNTISRGFFRFGPEIAYIMVEFTGNTGSSVTVEAHATLFAY
jgi:hypothetical protein